MRNTKFFFVENLKSFILNCVFCFFFFFSHLSCYNFSVVLLVFLCTFWSAKLAFVLIYHLIGTTNKFMKLMEMFRRNSGDGTTVWANYLKQLFCSFFFALQNSCRYKNKKIKWKKGTVIHQQLNKWIWLNRNIVLFFYDLFFFCYLFTAKTVTTYNAKNIIGGCQLYK